MFYLGVGAVGRVFRVKTLGNCSGALKITVGSSLVSSLYHEIDSYKNFEHLHLSMSNFREHSKVHPEGLYGGLVSFPVGSEPKFSNKETFLAAKESLKELFESGVVHGDARCPNFLYCKVEKRYFWADLRTVRRVNAGIADFDTTFFVEDHYTRYGSILKGKSG